MNTTRKWITRYTRLLSSPNGVKIRDLNANVVVTATEEKDGFTLIESASSFGYVKSADLEDYIENYPKNCVDIKDIQTPDLSDAEQYVLWDKFKQVNMCGELCVAYLLQISLADLLTKWKIKAPSFFVRVFGTGRARGTGSGELSEMLKLFEVNSVQLSSVLKTYTPGGLALFADKSIVSVNIDAVTGALRGSGVLHWVVPLQVMQERAGMGMVGYYNPFSNRVEICSWREFLASARSPYGIAFT